MTSTFEFCPDMATNEAVTVKVETCVDTPVCDAKDRADGLLMNLKQEPSPSFGDIQQQATFQVNRKARNQHISVANQNHCHSDGNSSCKSQARATLDTFRTTPTIQRPIQPKPSPKYFSSMFHMPKGQNPDVLKQHHLGAWHWQASQWPTARRTSNKRVYSRSRDKTYLSGNEPRIPCFPPRKKNSKSRRSSAKDDRSDHQYLGYNPQALRLCASLFGEKYGYNLKPRITSISELRNLPNTATQQHSGHQNSSGYFNVSLGALDQPDALSGYYATPCATSGSGVTVPNAQAPKNPKSPPEPRRKSYSLVSCHSGYNQPDYTHPVVDYRVAQTSQNSPCDTMYIPQNINQNISKHIPKVNIRRLTQHKSSCDVNHQKTSSRPVHRNSVRDGCHEEPLDLRVKPVTPTEGQQYSICADSSGDGASTSNPGFFNFENTQTANVRENQVDGNISRQDTIDTRAADVEYELCDEGYMEIKPQTEANYMQNESAIAIIPNNSEKEQILINTNENTSVPSHQATMESCDGVSCEEVEIAFNPEILKESHDASEAERKTDDDKRPIGDVTSKCAVNERDLLYELLKLRLVNTGQHKNIQVTKRKRGRPPKSKNRTIEPYKMDLQELYSSLRYPQRKRNRTKKFEIAIHKPKSRKKRGRPRVSQKTIMAEHNERKKRNMYQQEWRLKRKGLTAGSSDDELQQSRDDERQTDETYYDDEHKTEHENYGCGQKAGETVYGVVYRSDETDDDDETWGKEKNSNEEQQTECTDSSDENQTDGADYEDQLQTDEDDYASGSESDKDDYKSDSQADGTDYDSEQYRPTDDQDYNDEHQTAEKYYDDEHHQQDGLCCDNEPQNDLKEEYKTVGSYHNDKGEPDGTDNLGQWSPYFNNRPTDVLPNQKVSDCAYQATGPSGDVNRKCTVTDLPSNVNWEPVVILDRLDTETLRKCSS